MRTATDGKANSRLPLTRERVLSAAIVLADTGGIDSLSMRRLADELGVKAMSLYNHVADKDDILDGIVDLVFAEIAVPSDQTDGRRPCVFGRARPTRLSCAPWASPRCSRGPIPVRPRFDTTTP